MKCLLTITLIATFSLVTHAQDSSTTPKTSSPAANIVDLIGSIFKNVSNSLPNQSGLEQLKTGLNIVGLVLDHVKTTLDKLPIGSGNCARNCKSGKILCEFVEGAVNNHKKAPLLCFGDTNLFSIHGSVVILNKILSRYHTLFISVNICSVPQTAGYLGCFPDNSARVLNGATTIFRPNTIERCVAYCRQLNFKYAGAQYGEHCFCGNTMNQLSERLGEEKCNMECPGNAAQKCGGTWANSIYTT